MKINIKEIENETNQTTDEKQETTSEVNYLDSKKIKETIEKTKETFYVLCRGTCFEANSCDCCGDDQEYKYYLFENKDNDEYICYNCIKSYLDSYLSDLENLINEQ